MPKFEKKDKGLAQPIVIDTEYPREIADLKAQGFREVKAAEPAKAEQKRTETPKPTK